MKSLWSEQALLLHTVFIPSFLHTPVAYLWPHQRAITHTMAFTWLSVVVIRNLECIHIIVWYFVFISHSQIIVSCQNVSNKQACTFLVRRLNICAVSLKLDIAHFVHVIWMSDRWPPCILHDGLAKPRPVIRTSYWVDVHNGEKGSCTTWL